MLSNKVCRWAILSLIAALFLGCEKMGKEFPTSVEEQLNDEEDLIKSAFQEAFALNIPFPAYIATSGTSWTSTAYIGSEVFRVYVFQDSTFEANIRPVQRPEGIFHTISIGIDYGNTNISDVFGTLWVNAQSSINTAHRTFAHQQGYNKPLVSFINTNILISSGDINDPTSKTEVFAFLDSQGITQEDFDVVNVLNLDAQNSAGGFKLGSKFIHMGWFFGSEPFGTIDQVKAQTLANAIYGHEMSHVWGWEHEWSRNSNTNYNPSLAWTSPTLVGWVDTDDDGTPEILDQTPYGIGTATSVTDADDISIPFDFVLEQNYPNPFKSCDLNRF